VVVQKVTTLAQQELQIKAMQVERLQSIMLLAVVVAQVV
jgi:hypothetical protein